MTRNTTALSAWSTDTGLLLIRVMLGVVFLYHGWDKLANAGIDGFAGYLDSLGVPLPMLNAWMAVAAEIIGGLALVLGVGVRFAAVPLTITMLVAAFVAHGGAFDVRNNGMEYPLTLAVISAALIFLGAGRLTVIPVLRRFRTPSTSTSAAATA